MARAAVGAVVVLLLMTACGAKDAPRPPEADTEPGPPGELRDAETLGQEIFELVDRAVDYRGSHRGRPAISFRQMGIDSLTPQTARNLVNLAREPVVTARFRRAEAHEIISCRGDSQILEEAALNSGRYTLMCTDRSGAQRPVRVGE